VTLISAMRNRMNCAWPCNQRYNCWPLKAKMGRLGDWAGFIDIGQLRQRNVRLDAHMNIAPVEGSPSLIPAQQAQVAQPHENHYT
jgi:hypothetical protein